MASSVIQVRRTTLVLICASVLLSVAPGSAGLGEPTVYAGICVGEFPPGPKVCILGGGFGDPDDCIIYVNDEPVCTILGPA